MKNRCPATIMRRVILPIPPAHLRPTKYHHAATHCSILVDRLRGCSGTHTSHPRLSPSSQDCFTEELGSEDKRFSLAEIESITLEGCATQCLSRPDCEAFLMTEVMMSSSQMYHPAHSCQSSHCVLFGPTQSGSCADSGKLFVRDCSEDSELFCSPKREVSINHNAAGTTTTVTPLPSSSTTTPTIVTIARFLLSQCRGMIL